MPEVINGGNLRQKLASCLAAFLLPWCLSSQTSPLYDSLVKAMDPQLPDSVLAEQYYEGCGRLIREVTDLQGARVFADSLLQLASRLNADKWRASYYFAMGVIHRFEDRYPRALQFLDSNLAYYRNDSLKMAAALFQKGVIHRNMGDYAKSLEAYLDILQIYQAQHNETGDYGAASALNSIGNLYGEQGKTDLAIANFERALALFRALDKKFDIGNGLKNLANMYADQGEAEKAKQYLSEAIGIHLEIDNPMGQSTGLRSLGELYLEEEDYNRSQTLLRQALAASQRIGVKKEVSLNTLALGRLDLARGRLPQAIALFEEARALAEPTGMVSERMESNRLLADAYFQKGEAGLAYGYLNRYMLLKDSVFTAENARSVNLLEKRFETETKDREIAEQQLKIEQQSYNLARKRSQFILALLGGLAILIAAVTLWVIYRQRQRLKDAQYQKILRDKEVAMLEAIISGEENERFRIAKDLHDGVNGDLAAIKYKIASLPNERELSREKQYRQAMIMLDNACEQIRRISHNLTPPALENLTLSEAVRRYITKVGEADKTQFTYQYYGAETALPKNVETTIYRLIQELVNNIVKHAEATEAIVQLNNHGDSLHITVEDNGKGFDVRSEKDGIGLGNVQSRLQFLNGQMEVHSDGKGSSFSIQIDLTQFLST